MRWFVFAVNAAIVALAAQAPEVDPSLRAAVERFYAVQEAKDLPGYLSLWAKAAQDPQRQVQLKYVFDSGDDKFSNLTITKVRSAGDRTVVHVSVTRDRSSTSARRPDGTSMVFHTAMVAALTYVREGSEWKLAREGTPIDALADELIAASTPAGREAVLAAEPDLVGPALASAVSRQAAAVAQRGLFPQAQSLYERALELAIRVGDKKQQAETLQNLGNTFYYMRNFTDAKPVYEQRVALERELGNEEGIASALVGLGTAQYSQFEYTDAFASFREALQIQEKRSDNLGIATTLVSTGNIQFVEGDFDGAIVDYRRSRALYHELADTSGEARALDGLGRSLEAQGDLAGALDAFKSVLEAGRKANVPTMQGTALLNIGDVHFRLGNLDTARGLFDQSREQFENGHDPPNAGHAWQAMAMTDLVAARFPLAEEEYGRSATVCTTAGDPECVARAMVGSAFAQSSQGRYSLAVASYRKAVAAFTTLKNREDSARAEIGLTQALLGAAEYAAALTTARHARTEGLALGRRDVIWRATVSEARALRASGNPTAALTAAKEAVSEVERMAQDSLDGWGELPPADSVAAYIVLAVVQAERNDAISAFGTLERSRVHALRTALARNERDIARGMTAGDREDERRLAAEVITVRAQLDHERALPKPNAARIDRLKERLSRAVGARTEARRELFARLPDLRTWRGLQPAAGLDAAAGLLTADGDTLVEFVIDDEDLLVVVLSRGPERVECKAYLTPVSRQTLAERIAHAVEPAALRDVDAWRSAAAELVKSIPEGAWAAMQHAPRLIVVPDDVLWRVPFEALPVDEGFLADRTNVLYSSSATSLVIVPVATPSSTSATMVVVGAPDLAGATRDRIQAIAPDWTLRDADAATAEVRLVAGLFDEPPATVLSGSGATEASLRAGLATASIVHVAAPFRMNGASPLFSPILLTAESSAADAGAEKDGVLEAREVMNLELHGRIAVFTDGSSASTRGAAPAAGTLQWAWRAAGIPVIVFTRWAVDDEPSNALLSKFYDGLKGNDTPDVAMQAARASLRSYEETRAPYFWAGFMVVGR